MTYWVVTLFLQIPLKKASIKSASVRIGDFTPGSYDDVIFDSNFDMGNLKNVAYVSGSPEATETTKPKSTTLWEHDPNRGTNTDKHWWFYFSMDNVAGKTVTITIKNGAAADYADNPTSGNRWTQIEPVYQLR